jgi:hypothetical protein
MAPARIFEQAGWVGRQAILMTGINSIFYILSTIPPLVWPGVTTDWILIPAHRWYFVDRWGRRFILLSGAVMVIHDSSLFFPVH